MLTIKHILSIATPFALLIFSVAIIAPAFNSEYFIHHEKTLQKNQILNNKLYEQKQMLLKQDDVIHTSWLHTLNPLVKKVQGSVIWSNKKQSGVMVFNNLPILGKKQNYRLWIYDLEESMDHAISGASFKYGTNAEKQLFVSIKPDKYIKRPYKFELVLENTYSENVHPLLFAQP